jgi:small-conductance mechanosensitive channel
MNLGLRAILVIAVVVCFVIAVFRSVFPNRPSWSTFHVWPRMAHSASRAPAFGLRRSRRDETRA